MNHLDNSYPERHYVKVLIENNQGELLLLNHSHIKRPGFMLPGGECELGEYPLITLKRELGEELIADFGFTDIRLCVNQILQLPGEDFFRYGSLYYMYHEGDISIQESEKRKFGEAPIWIPKADIYSPVTGLREDNRLMILQILRIKDRGLPPQKNLLKIR